MFEINMTDKVNMHQYLKKSGCRNEFKYLFTYEKKYIFAIKENMTMNSYYVINISAASTEPILRSKHGFSEAIQNKLVEKLSESPYYKAALPESPLEMIDYIFRKLMTEKGFVIRENQIELSKTMYEGIKNNHVAICEAEVGTGKTFAYLVASLVYVLYERKGRIQTGKFTYLDGEDCYIPCAISTSSIDLQNAIIKTYVPVLSELLIKQRIIAKPLSAVLRKGKDHYFCQMRYDRLMDYLKSSQKAIDIELLIKLRGMKISEGSIDLDEYKGLKNHITQKINIPKSCEITCPYYKNCRYIAHMDNVRSAIHDFQVCNHNYYLADTVKRDRGKHTLLPEHALVIFDEAHKLTEAAIQILGTRFTSDSVHTIANILKSNLKGNKAYLTTAKRMIEDMEITKSRFFTALTSRINSESIDDDASQIRIVIGYNEKQMLLKIISQIEKIKAFCVIDISKNRNLEILIAEIIEQVNVFYRDENIIYWLENPGSERFVSVCSIPTDLERQLRNLLWVNGIPKIVTSGTLSDDNGFDYFKRTTGIDKISSDYIKETSCKSPFDYRNNALLYVSEKVPFPDKQSTDYISALAEEILNLVKTTSGHTAILFTSYTLLSKIYELIKDQIEFPIIKMDKSVKNIVETFKKSGNGVLFATGSFWEGVDCPGDILSSLIIVNMPFPTPTPILDNKKEELADIKTFIDTIVFPEMIIKLKQGMGRLLRSETDTGVVAILDFRISTKGKYRRRVLRALSDYRATDSLDEVNRFLHQVKSADYFCDSK
ncbi:ATP-dependent DNA helicase [Dehalobacter sp. 14DCB1]|uniref:ATP-dependent DNA helicase n=1 Tax=Dehalobacter sp. 14DCB1 TaxID=2070227 RepID=UPI001050C09D|nr:ATP-dependent DNA helicase [Dehalobacter sp. 14DCB1]TCX53574.1 ATP-dependent DNA helicase [Dehalobacter sp. 14DCB1]